MFDDKTEDEILRMAAEVMQPTNPFGGGSAARSRFSHEDELAILERAAQIEAARKAAAAEAPKAD